MGTTYCQPETTQCIRCSSNNNNSNNGLYNHELNKLWVKAVKDKNFVACKLMLEEDPLLVNSIVSIGGESGCHFAVRCKHTELLEFLIDNNCDINVKDINGNTALHSAALRHNTKCIRILLENGAKYDIMNRKRKVAKDLARDLRIRGMFRPKNVRKLIRERLLKNNRSQNSDDNEISNNSSINNSSTSVYNSSTLGSTSWTSLNDIDVNSLELSDLESISNSMKSKNDEYQQKILSVSNHSREYSTSSQYENSVSSMDSMNDFLESIIENKETGMYIIIICYIVLNLIFFLEAEPIDYWDPDKINIDVTTDDLAMFLKYCNKYKIWRKAVKDKIVITRSKELLRLLYIITLATMALKDKKNKIKRSLSNKKLNIYPLKYIIPKLKKIIQRGRSTFYLSQKEYIINFGNYLKKVSFPKSVVCITPKSLSSK